MSGHATSRSALRAGLFWGAVWGLYEATVGYLIHSFVRMPGTASVLMVPFAVFCLLSATQSGGARRSAAVAALTAAAIKLVDLALPLPNLLAVLNPAAAILMEGLAFTLVARQLGLPGRRPTLPQAAVGALLFSTGWRVLFLGWSAVLAAGWSVGMMKHGLHAPLGFLVRDSLLSAAVIVGLVSLTHGRGRTPLLTRSAPGAAAVAAVLLLAVAAEVAVGLFG
ncbi:MAG: hypothetical protein R3D98_07005 [Candidatus Krumholzibacteriia bacterium]